MPPVFIPATASKRSPAFAKPSKKNVGPRPIPKSCASRMSSIARALSSIPRRQSWKSLHTEWIERREDMRSKLMIAVTCAFATGFVSYAFVRPIGASASQAQADSVSEPVKVLVDRLDLERYKATIKGLTQFGDRRQGTDRNRQAIDWIEAQLKSYGCANIERLKYDYQPSNPDTRSSMAYTAACPGTPTPQNATYVGGRHPT